MKMKRKNYVIWIVSLLVLGMFFGTFIIIPVNASNLPPIALANPDHQTIYIGEDAWFSGNSSYDPDGYLVSYLWDFGDGSTGNGTVVTHSYNSLGNYTVTLTVIDNEGSTDSDTCTVTVREQTPPPPPPPPPPPQSDDDWPMFNHDPQHTGYSTSDAPDSPNLLWTFSKPQRLTSPSVANGTVVVASWEPKVYALDVDNGGLIWSYEIQGVPSQPVIANEMVFVSVKYYFDDGYDYHIYSFDLNSGDLLWEWNANSIDWLNSQFTSSYAPPLSAANNRIYFCLNSYADGNNYITNFVFCLDDDTGDLLWNANITDSLNCYMNASLTIGNDKIFLSTNHNLYGLSETDGDLLWKFHLNLTTFFSAPAFIDDKVFIGNDYTDEFYCLNANTGGVIWQKTLNESNTYMTPSIVDNKVIVGANEINTGADPIYALDKNSGNVLWRYDYLSLVISTPAIADNKVYCTYNDGTIRALDLNNGNFLWKFTAPDVYQGWHESNAIAYGKLFVSIRHKMYVFGPGTPMNQNPVADAEPDAQTVDIGEEVDFSGCFSYDPDGIIVSYEWDFGDGNSGSGVNVSHTYYFQGDYTVCLTVTDDDGATDSDFVTVTVLGGGNQPPVADAQPYHQHVDVGEIAWFSGNGSYDPDGYIISYHWNFGDGTSGTGNITWHVYQFPGNYTVTLTVTDNHGATDTDYVNVQVFGNQTQNQPPVADAYPEHQIIDSGEEAWFTGNSSYDPDGHIVSYEWNFGDGTSASGVEVTHTYNSSGDYTVTLTVTDNEGATDSDFVTVTVLGGGGGNQPPVADADPEHQHVDVGEKAWFWGNDSYDPDGYIVSYLWNFGDGTSEETGELVTHIYHYPGNYTVTLTVTDNEGATNTDYVNARVFGNQTQNKPPVAHAYPEHQVIDSGEQAWFTGNRSYDPDGYIVSYHWYFGDGKSGSGITITHTYNSPGNYTVTLMVTDDDGAADSDSVIVTVSGGGQNQPPVAEAHPDHQLVYVGEEAWFSGNGSYDPDGYIVYYHWDFGDGNSESGVTVTHVYNSSGNYTVTLTVTDNHGAQDSDTIFVTVCESESDNWSPVADAGEDRFASPYEILTFNGNGSFDFDGAIVSYDWDFGDGTSAQGMIVTHTFTESRTYIVNLKVVDDEGATDTETCIIFMTDQVPIMFPEKEHENDTLPQPKVIPEIESEKQTPDIINKQKPILIITAGLINIATFDEETERIVPVEVTAYYGDVSNVRIEVIDDGGLEIEIIPIVQDVPSGEIVRFYLVIKEPETFIEDEGRGITIKLKAVSEDTESNIEHIDVVITEKITEGPIISEVEIISTAGTISVVTLLAILVKRRFF
jgi:PKD repeat protein